MSFYHNPKIVTDNLVFYVDAKNYKSYISGSLDIRELTSVYSASFVDGSPTFDNDAWQIDGLENYAAVRRESPGDLVFTSDDYTVEVWAKPKITGNHAYAFSIWNTGAAPGTNEWLLGFPTGYGQFAIADATNTSRTVTGVKTTPLNTWHNLVGVRSNSTMSLYLDGELDGTPLSNDALSGSANTVTPLYIGAIRNNTTIPLANANVVFSGSIAVAKIYNRALSTTEIKSNYIALKGRFGK